MRYKLLVLDLDGTLTNKEKKITPKTLDSLLKVQEMGIKLVLASGRPTFGITPLAKELKMDQYGGYILSYNGGKIINFKSGEIILEKSLPKDLIPWLHQQAKESDTTILSYENQFIVTEKPEDKYVQHEQFLTKMELKKVNDFTKAISFHPDKCLIVGEPEKLIPLEEIVSKEIGHRLNVFRSEPFFLELVPKGIDKAKSLQTLLNRINLTKEEMIAVGDGYNDLSMIEFAGLGVAMANAQEPVKACADYITLSNEEDGVAHLIEKFIFNAHFSQSSVSQINEACEDSLISNLGIKFTSVDEDEIIAKMPVDKRTKQPYGVLHGGASLAFAESIAGVGSRLYCDDTEFAVGMQISGNHVSSAIEGDTVFGTGKIIHKGRSTHVWNIDITTHTGKLVSTVRVINSILKKR